MSKTSAVLSLRVLARLLSYPDTAMRGHLPAMREALRRERAITAGRLAELDALMDALSSADPLDASWSEPPAFDGCSPKGQSRPGQPQPIRIVRKDNSAKGAPA